MMSKDEESNRDVELAKLFHKMDVEAELMALKVDLFVKRMVEEYLEVDLPVVSADARKVMVFMLVETIFEKCFKLHADEDDWHSVEKAIEEWWRANPSGPPPRPPRGRTGYG